MLQKTNPVNKKDKRKILRKVIYYNNWIKFRSHLQQVKNRRCNKKNIKHFEFF